VCFHLSVTIFAAQENFEFLTGTAEDGSGSGIGEFKLPSEDEI